METPALLCVFRVWCGRTKMVLLKARMMRRCEVLCKDASELETLVAKMEECAKQPSRLAWTKSPSLAVPSTQDWEALEVEDLSASGLEEGV